VGNEAAAYLFGLALSSVDLSAFGSMGQDRFNRNDAVLEFPPGSGQRVSLTEISDALRYKYSIDPLVEFSSSVGLAGYSLADVNSVLQALNSEYKGRFEHPLLSRSEGGAEAVYITQETPAAALSDILTAQARQALADARIAEVSLQRTQLEELMQSLSRSRDENLVVDIEAALRMAQQQAQLTGSAEPLLAALKSAQQRVQRAAQPRLAPVLRALASGPVRAAGSERLGMPDLAGLLADAQAMGARVLTCETELALADLDTRALGGLVDAVEPLPSFWRDSQGPRIVV
jgi:hypothetical protein